MKVKPIKEKYIYFFTYAELYNIESTAVVGGPELMASLPLGNWERINVAQGKFIIEQGIQGEYDERSWYRVSEEFTKAHVYNTFPALIGPTKIIHSRIYKEDKPECDL